MTATRDQEYEEFGTFPDRGPAESLCAWLEFEGVLKKLAHRARWIVPQLPPTDAELEFLTTGKLPGQGDETKP